ncbi:MAG: ribonuclease H-like domain-containing protein [Myxococcota bacterium]
MSGRELIDNLKRRIARFDTSAAPARAASRLRVAELPGARDERPVRFHTRLRVESSDVAGTAVLAGAAFDSRRALYLDTETTGLSTTAGTLPFLIGYAWFEAASARPTGRAASAQPTGCAGELCVEQLLMRGPEDERAALERLADRVRSCSGLVTFNGRSFDVPLLEVRYVLSRLRSPFAELPHLDLLAPSRRLFGSRMSSCRLVALEEGVLGERREGDIGGHLIPGLYNEYLRSGDASGLAGVVDHNRRDIVSMPRLLAVLARKVARPLEEAEDAYELIAVGRMHLGGGDADTGLRCFERAARIATLPRARRLALVALAHALRRRGDVEALAGVWERYARDFPGENLGYVELAKVHEHRRRDPAAALKAAAAAPETTESLLRRLRRLRARIAPTPVPRAAATA